MAQAQALRAAFRIGGSWLIALALAACSQGPHDAGVASGHAGGKRTAAASSGPVGPAANIHDPVVAGAPAEGALASTEVVQAAQIVDHAGFGQPMVVADLQVPAGWTTAGGVSWNDGTSCVTNQLQFGWTAMGPDTVTAVELLPGFNWQVAGTQVQMNPCPVAPLRSARDLLAATVERTRPGARVLDYRDRADLAQPPSQGVGGAQVSNDVGQMLIAYARDGIDMRELLTASVLFSNMQGNVMGGTSMIQSTRAPNGRLDTALAQRISASMKPNPQWMDAMRQRGMAAVERYGNDQRRSIQDWHSREMAMINARGAADRQAIRMRGNAETAAIYSQTAASTSRSNDVIQAGNLSAIGEYSNYAGTDGTTVQSSIHGGSRVFQSNDVPGDAYSTDDPYHDPANATELERIP